MSHEAETKKEATAVPETEQTVTPEAEPKAEKKVEGKHEHHHEKAALEAKLEASEKKNEELKNQLLRTAAEYDNYRKRSQREADQKFNDGVSHAVTQILGILDTLDMAANAVCADENYKKGVMMTLDKAGAAFSAMGVEEIEAQDKPFDPELHAAVMQQQAPEGVESGTVVQVLQKGYTYNGKVIRHAAVAVAQ